MQIQYHSGHGHFAAHSLPPMPTDCAPIEATYNASSYQHALAQIGGKLLLPDMPEAIVMLAQTIYASNPNLSHIVKIIESNPIISGELLGTVSQPAFQKHLQRHIEIVSIQQCVTLIGLERTYQLAMGAAFKQMLPNQPLVRDIIAYANKTAYACAEIVGYLPPHDPRISQERAYLFGLYLHGGMLALAAHYPEDYATVFAQSLHTPDSAHKIEQTHYASHALLGVLTAEKWGINRSKPQDLALLLAIAWHHYHRYDCIQQTTVRLLIATGLLAQSMVSELALGAYQSQEMLTQSALASRVLGLSDEALSNIRKNLNTQWRTFTASEQALHNENVTSAP
ncbi:MAG: HDOD domain-containing protein [Thiotrichales bacterium]|jgi:HD-like signal output (HDOD) protein|nr:HDOD domain-containing protein [Thiotrichales bacterium]